MPVVAHKADRRVPGGPLYREGAVLADFYLQIRLSNQPLAAPRNTIDIFVALDRESISSHEHELPMNGRILGDAPALKLKSGGPAMLEIPFEKPAPEQGGDKIMANTGATGPLWRQTLSAWP